MLDTRAVLRAFAPFVKDPRYLRWDHALESQDGTSVRIALLDSGINHYRDDLSGADLTARDFTRSGTVLDRTGHGTGNASLLVAQGHRWVRGVCPRATLMVAKVLGRQSRERSVQAIVSAVRWAIARQADVIVLPFGTSVGSRTVAAALRRAAATGCRIFAAAGNRGPSSLQFPANQPFVTAVSGARLDGVAVSLCCDTPRVDCFAPGDQVPTLGHVAPVAHTVGSSPAAVLAAGVYVLRLGIELEERMLSDGG
jgi:subtilisin family serine protease